MWLIILLGHFMVWPLNYFETFYSDNMWLRVLLGHLAFKIILKLVTVIKAATTT